MLDPQDSRRLPAIRCQASSGISIPNEEKGRSGSFPDRPRTSSNRSLLAGNLAAETADQAGGILANPLVAEACRLAVSSYFLSVPATQVQEALRDQDSAECEQECKEANIYPGETHDSLQLSRLPSSRTEQFELLGKQNICHPHRSIRTRLSPLLLGRITR